MEKASRSSRQAYTVQFKLGVVQWMKKHESSARAAARMFGVHRKMIRSWMDREEALVAALQTCGPNRRKLNSGRPPLSQDLDQLVLEWLRGRNELCSVVTDRDIQQRALNFATKLRLPHFKASPMWLKRWKLRNRVAFRDGSNQIVPVCVRTHGQPSIVSGDAFLSHVDPSEKIKLLFEEGNSSETIDWPANQVHYDYSTPEHNYYRLPSPPTLTPIEGRTLDCVDTLACFEPSEFLHTSIESLNSLYGLEEVVGKTDTSFYVVLDGQQSPCGQVASSSGTVHPNPGTLSGIADRRSQPIFHLGPKMVYSSVDCHGESSPT